MVTILNKKQTVLSVILLILVVLLTVSIAGCAPAKPTAPAPEAPKPQVHKLRIATAWPSAIPAHQVPVRWAQDAKVASGGRLDIEVHPAGAIVPAPEILDSASARAIDGYHAFASYWIGKMPAAPFFSAIPMTLEPFMLLTWIYEGGGLELWQRMYDEAGYNVKIIPLGLQHPDILAWSNKPLSKFEDWEGLKYRTVGWWAEILRGKGVAVTSLPAAELYPALERGVIDAMEFTSPFNDKTLAFYEIADYLTGPGMHAPGVLHYLGINKDSWNALPADLQALLETTARSVTLWSWSWDFSGSMDAIDYFQEKNVQLVKVEESVQKELKNATWAMLDKRAAEKGGIFAETWNSIKKLSTEICQLRRFNGTHSAEKLGINTSSLVKQSLACK